VIYIGSSPATQAANAAGPWREKGPFFWCAT
jgi:hypothetical protein